MDSGKDPVFKKFEGECERCKGQVTFDKGVKLKGSKRTAFSFDELNKMYEKFEAERISKAQKLLGNREIKPDHIVKFIAERTNFCPHSLVDNQSIYWIETVSLLDGEMGLTLPATMSEIPALFFEALSVVRSARARARKEDRKEP